MAPFYVLIGSLIPALAGWLLLDLLEWKTITLTRMEKWGGGFLLGSTLSMFIVFAMHELTRIPLTLWTYLGVFAGMILPLAIAPRETSPLWLRTALFAFSGWVLLRMLAFAALLFWTPTFYDDTLDNWNLRGKIFFIDKKITLVFPWASDATGVSSYPPTVPLFKAWLTNLAGEWGEGLVNGIHIVWFIALLALVYSLLRRVASWQWALLGTTLLASLPLEFVQGTGTYADIFVSAHVLFPVVMLFLALRSMKSQVIHTFFRMAALGIALVPFTKNEGWALYFPILVFLFIATLLWTVRSKKMTATIALRAFAWLLLFAALICVPWIGFKVMNGLTFGNAKGIDLSFAWQPGVLAAVIVNTFFEANWAFLFPLAIGVIVARWKSLRRPDLLLLFLAFFLPYGVQHFAYFFTGLSQEAIFQTGYARGIVHIVPILVILTILLLRDLLKSRNP